MKLAKKVSVAEGESMQQEIFPDKVLTLDIARWEKM